MPPACEAVLIELFYDNQARGKWIYIGHRTVGREEPTCEPVPLKGSQILDQAGDAFQQDRPVGHAFPFYHVDVSMSTRMAYPSPIRPPPAQRDCVLSGHLKAPAVVVSISPHCGVVPGRIHDHALLKRESPAYSPCPGELTRGAEGCVIQQAARLIDRVFVDGVYDNRGGRECTRKNVLLNACGAFKQRHCLGETVRENTWPFSMG